MPVSQAQFSDTWWSETPITKTGPPAEDNKTWGVSTAYIGMRRGPPTEEAVARAIPAETMVAYHSPTAPLEIRS